MQDIPAESVKDADSDRKVPYVRPLLRASGELEPLEDKEQLFVSFQQAQLLSNGSPVLKN
jgi:hypothetical protein